MWSHLVRAMAIAAILGGVGNATPFGQQVLKWKLQPGQRLNYVVQQDMKISIDYNGQEIGSSMRQIIDTTWLANGVDRLGNIRVAQRINRIQIRLDGTPAGRIEFDTAAKGQADPKLQAMKTVFDQLLATEINTTMGPTGKIVKIDVPQKLLDTLKNAPGVGAAGFTEESLKQMFNQSGVVMPKTPINVGGKWTAANEVTMPAGRMVFNSMLTYRGLQDFEGRRYARIDLKPSVQMVPDPESPVQVKVKSAAGQGAVLFDYERGNIKRTKMTSRIVMTVTQQGESIDQNIDQTVEMRLVPQKMVRLPGGPTRGE